MRIPMLVMAFFILSVGIGAPAEAQNYPWCAQYSYRDGATCGFTTFDQCMATISGIGGFCHVNNQYVPPAALGRHRSSTHYSG